MKSLRIPWTTRRVPWAAAAALLFSLSGCDARESTPAPAPVSPPDAPAQKSERTEMPPPKAEPAPPPVLESQPPPVLEPQPPPVPAPEPAPEPSPEPAPKPADVSVTGFETGGTVGPDGHVGDAKTVFAPADTVNLAVLADGAARAVRVSVTWLGPDGARVHEEAQDLTLGAPKAVPFALADAKGLALGRYKAEIRIEGWLASTAEFEVR